MCGAAGARPRAAGPAASPTSRSTCSRKRRSACSARRPGRDALSAGGARRQCGDRLEAVRRQGAQQNIGAALAEFRQAEPGVQVDAAMTGLRLVDSPTTQKPCGSSPRPKAPRRRPSRRCRSNEHPRWQRRVPAGPSSARRAITPRCTANSAGRSCALQHRRRCVRQAGPRPIRTGSRSSNVRADGTTEDITFGWLRETSNRLANTLAAHGVARGDRVAMLLPQTPEAAAGHIAIYKLGAIAVPLAILFGVDALSYRLQNAGVKARHHQRAGAREAQPDPRRAAGACARALDRRAGRGRARLRARPSRARPPISRRPRPRRTIPR